VARSYTYNPGTYDQAVISALLTIAVQRGLGTDHQLAALACGLVEDQLRHRAGGHGTSVGWRQETRSSYGSVERRMDLAASINRFYDELGPSKPSNLTLGRWVQSVQRSAYPDEYDAALPTAQQVLAANGGGAGLPTGGGGTATGGQGYTGPDLGPPPPNRPTLPVAVAVLDSPTFGPSDVVLEGDRLEGRFTVLSGTVRRGMDMAPTVTLEVSDHSREALNSPILQTKSILRIGDLAFLLTAVSKRGDLLTLTFVDALAAHLMYPGGPDGSAPAGTVTRGGWIRTLVEAGYPGAVTEVEEGDWVIDGPLARGDESDPDRSVWDATREAAEKIGWRRYVSESRFYCGSDEFLYDRFPPIVIAEHAGGIGSIDFDYDTNITTERVSFVTDAKLWSSPPGTAILVERLGVAAGEWLVESVERRLGSTETTVVLTRQVPELPEPEPAPVDVTGDGVGSGGTGGPIVSGAVSPQGYMWPMSGPEVDVISEWGAPRGGGSRSHKGIDIGAPIGHPVYAARAGMVTRVINTDTGNPGLRVVIDHGDAETDYMHNSRNLVSVGVQVAQGQQIAECGKTGNARTTPPHVHFECRPGGSAQNPRNFLP